MAKSRTQATIPEYNPYGSRQIYTNTSNSISRPSFNRPQPIDLRKSKYTQTTYNENYPWLNESSYKKLEAAVEKMGLSGEEKRTAMDQWYRNNVKYLLNDQTLEERAKAINEQAYQAAELKNPEADAQLRMTEFSQALKKKYNLDATADDLEVFNTFVSDLWEEWVNLAWQYLSWENKKLRYDAGLETWWEKAADLWVWVLQSPWKRGYNMIWQWMDKLWKRWAEQLEWSALEKWVQDKAIDLFWENEVRAYQQQMAEKERNWTLFNGREATDIRTPLLWEERANNWWTKAWEVVGDIGSAIALTAPMWVATAPMYADSTVLWAWVLWAWEWALWTILSHYGTEWDLNIKPTEAVLWVGGWILGWELTRYLANLPKSQTDNIRKEASWYIEKSIRPTVKGKQNQTAYDKFIDDTLDVAHMMSKNKDILQYTDDAWEVVKWKLPTNMRETSETLRNLKKVIYDQYNEIAKQAGDAGARVDLNKAFQNLDDLAKNTSQNIANPKTPWIIDEFKRVLLEYSDDAWTISIDDAQQITQDFNKQLTTFLNNTANTSNDVSRNSIISKLNKWLKDGIDDSIDDTLNKWISNGSSASQQYNQLKWLYGKIKTIEDEISKRALVLGRNNKIGLSQQILDSLSWWEFTEALLSLDPAKLWKAGIMKAISKYTTWVNNPNTSLKKLFELVESVDNPTAFQTAKNSIWNAIRSTAQSSAPIVWTVTPWLAWVTATELTNE